jgi:hypothetical protein
VRAQIEGYVILPYWNDDDSSTTVLSRCHAELVTVTPNNKHDDGAWAKAWLMIYPDLSEDTVVSHKFKWIREAEQIDMPDPREYVAVDAMREGEERPEFRYMLSVKRIGLYYHLYYLGQKR